MLEMAKKEPNLEVYLNCTCMDGEMDEDRLARITGWQMTTQQYHVFEAGIFADCSGDSILAPITGALYRMGREGYEEYGEDIAPTQADSHTMGMSCMIQAREYPEERTFIAPTWARKFTKEDLPASVIRILRAMETTFGIWNWAVRIPYAIQKRFEMSCCGWPMASGIF